MENNQEHKLDNFFKKSLENQAFPPPENLWSSIATETIAKESSGIKPLLKYTILSLGLMVVGAITIWSLTDDEIVKEHHQKIASLATEVHPKQILVVQLDENVVVKNSTPNEVKSEKNEIENSRSKLVSFVNHVEKESVKPTVHGKYKTYTGLRSTKINDAKINQALIETDNNSKAILVDTDSKIVKNNLHILHHKDLVLNNVSIKNNKSLIGKIRPIQPMFDEETDKSKDKTVETGSKFSLKHPIISFDYGSLWNEWTFKSDKSLTGTTMYPEKGLKGYNFKAGVAWKLTKRSRMGISLAYSSYDVGTPYIYLPIWSSLWVSPKINLTTKNGMQYYSAVLPTGTVNIPVDRFDDFVTKVPNTLDSTRGVFLFENHTMKTYSLALTTQNDIVSFQSKKKKHLNFQLYAVADFVFQRQTSYNYIAQDELSMLSSAGTINEKGRISYNSNHLENASNLVFGIRAGLGIRWQFAPRLGLHVEGTTQNSFNSWVQNQELKTYMRTNALQAGINLSL